MKKAILITLFFCIVSLSMGQTAKGNTRTGFTIHVTEMTPMAYQGKMVSGEGYSLSLGGDSVTFYLPYVGEAHQVDLNYNGLNMSRPVYNLTWETKCKKTKARGQVGKSGKTDREEVTFCCRRDMIEYCFRITLYHGGKAYIFLQPSNAQSISYSGDWD